MQWINTRVDLPFDDKLYYVKVLYENGTEDVLTGKEVNILYKKGASLDWKPFINSEDIYKRDKGLYNY